MENTATTPVTETQDDSKADRRRVSKKVRALLAGGLVLGLGATVTLAAWNDSEFATGTFTAGTFNLEGSTDGTSYGSHAASAPASLAFTVPAGNLSPGAVVYAPFAVRLDSTTTSSASVAISIEGSTGVVSNVSYSLIQTTAFGCDATSTGTTLVSAGTALNAVSGVAAFNLAKGAASAAGAPAYLCFAVTAGAIAQGQTGSVTWEFAATSAS